MRRIYYLIAGIAMLISACVEPQPQEEYASSTVGAYILNNGNYSDNDSNLSFIDFEKDVIIENVFEKTNGKLLGNLGQDLLVFGSKIYIAVNGSGIIFVTNLDGKILKEIVTKENGETLSPRYLTNYGDAVYVSYYQGFVGKIDTVSFGVTTVACGPNPDNLKFSGNKLFVATSGGYNYPVYCSTIDVFNADLSGRKTIDVVTNPQYLEVNSKGDVYLISTGNYADIQPSLQKIDPTSYSVTKITDIINPSIMTIYQDKLYIVTKSYDESWNTVCDFVTYNTTSNKLEGKIISDGTKIDNACSISINSDNGDIYIGETDYVTNGDLYKLTPAGVLVKKYDTGGVNPMGVFFIKR